MNARIEVGGWIHDGDVLPVADSPDDQPRFSREEFIPDHPRSTQTPEALTRAALTERNVYLNKMAEHVGAMNQRIGAAQLDSSRVTGIYGGVEKAIGLSEASRRRAKQFGNLACDVCPLRGACSDVVTVEALVSSGDRRRFVARLGGKGYDQLCSTNLAPGRLNKSA